MKGSMSTKQLTDEAAQLILGALDSLAVALTAHDHEWTAGERAIYELAVEALTPAHP